MAKKIQCTAPSGKVYTWTEKSLEKAINDQLEKLIDVSCSTKHVYSLRFLAEKVLERELGTEKERCVLRFMLDNEKELGIHLEYSYRYEEENFEF